ncbi:ficolin-1-A-like [Gigantopelta aegis]|uniref:ficolin-1-A-like n=1 Tax=Gigantopelta aegis TaxID=1735272 RepID=UPI001B88B2AF|nr:ficolin-1-A-like [Gigantopelta aegis]
MECLTEQRNQLKKELDQCLSPPPPTTTSPIVTTTSPTTTTTTPTTTTTTTTSPTTTITSPTTTTTSPLPPPISDCWDVKTRQNQSSDGTYTIDSPAGGKVNVRCDMTTDNGGWLTFVRRVKGGVDFNRPWEDYKNGFGDLAGDFWLGNDFLHMFTAAKDVEMRVDMRPWNDNPAYALYDSLHVDDEANNYTIHVGNYSGDAGDALRSNTPRYSLNNMPFNTYDRDNKFQCAKDTGGGFWFNHCTHALLTGVYEEAIIWNTWRSFEVLTEIAMSIRPKGVV